MKYLFSILLLISVSAGAQTTFYTKYKTGWSTDSCNARITLPAGYPFTATDSVQCIMFFCGLGEVGTDNTKILVNGPHAYMTGGWDGGVALGNGTHYPIIISIQEPAAYYNPFYYKRVIDTIMSRYKIFKRSLHMTGLSMGGWTANSFVIYRPAGGTDSSFSYRAKSVVDVEGVLPDDCKDGTICPYPTAFPSFARNGGYSTNGYSWNFEQSNDNRRIVEITNAMNAAVSGTSQYVQTSFGSGGHGSFNQFYGDGSTTPVKWAGFHPATSGQNIYQWMLRQGDTVNDLHSGNSPPTVNAGSDQTINLPTSSVTMAGSASGNGGASITSHTWSQVSGPSTATITTATSYTTTITGLIQGTYVFKLSATDNNSLTSTDQINVIVNASGSTPTANAGGSYFVDQSNGFDVTLNGSATGSNLKYIWTLPCSCYKGNDKTTNSSYTGGDPQVANIIMPLTLSPQIIQMKLSQGDSVHIYKFVLRVTDSVTGQFATDTAIVYYRYWNKFPPQNTDGAAGGHRATTSDSVNYIGKACKVGVDWVTMGAGNTAVRGLNTDILVYPNYADTFNLVPGATWWINPGPYGTIHVEGDTAGSAAGRWKGWGDTTKAGNRVMPFPNAGRKLTTHSGSYWANIRNTVISGEYDSAKGWGDVHYQGGKNGYAYSDTSYYFESDNCYRSIAGHGHVLEGISSQWVTFEYCSSIRGNFGGFTLKAEYSGILNPSTRSQLYWYRLRVNHCFVRDAHGEDYYIGSANDPAVWLIDCNISNNRSLYSGNKLFKTIDLFTRDTVANNVGSFGSINAPSPFENDVSVAQEVEFVNGGNLIYNNIINGSGNQGLNLILQKFKGPPVVGTNTIRNCLYYHPWGQQNMFAGQQDSAFTVIMDSLFIGGNYDYQFNKWYSGVTGTYPGRDFYATTAGSVPGGATKATFLISNITWDTTKSSSTILYTGVANFTNTNPTRVSRVVPPAFTNSGFADGQYPMQWCDTVRGMWGDEYLGQTDVRYGTPVAYDLGQVVKWFDKFYISKIANNVMHCPTGATDAYWTLMTFSNGGTMPPGDVTLINTSPYAIKGMGLTLYTSPPPPPPAPNCNCIKGIAPFIKP